MTPLEEGALVLSALAAVAGLLRLWLWYWTRRRIASLKREIAATFEKSRVAFASFDEDLAAFSDPMQPELVQRLRAAQERELRRIADAFEAETGMPLEKFEAQLTTSRYTDDETFLHDCGIKP